VTHIGGEDGFSLIEALVALLILGVTTAGLIRAAEAHVDSIRGMERRAAAQWVAENRLVEARLGIAATPAVQMMGSRWTATVTEGATSDPDLRAITVAVAAAGEATPLVTLDGFRDAGTTTSGRR
jgi:general secretion pathway protein I